MNDDERLLSALGAAAREGDPLADPRWQALSAGELPAGDEEALAALAKEDGRSEELMEAFRPLGADAEARIIERVMAAPAGEAPAGGEAAPGGSRPKLAVVDGGARTPPRKEGAAADGPRSRVRVLFAAASAVALAAVLALGIWISAPGSVPGYTMTLAGGERVVRSGDEPQREIERFGPGSRLEITLRPAAPVSGPIEVRTFLVRDGRARPLDAPAEVAQGGSVRIWGTKESLFAGVPPGRWEIVVAVGRPGALPREDTVASARGEEAPYRLLRREILLEEP